MKKGFKCTVAIVLGIVLMALLAACGGNNDAPAPTPVPAPTPAAAAPAPAPAPAPGGDTADLPDPVDAAPQAPDLGGRVIRISTQQRDVFGFLGPMYAEENAFRAADPESAHYFRESLQIANRLRVEEMFNIVIDVVHTPGGGFITTYRESALAGERFADIWEASGAQNMVGAVSGYIYALDELAERLYAETGATLSFMTDRHTAWPWLEFDGHIYSIGRPLPTMSNTGLLLNFGLLERFGAPNPVELYHAGQWTWDALRNILQLTTVDVDGDGVIDYYGFSGSINSLLMQMVIANGGRFVDPNTLTLGHTTPQAMEGLEFAYEIMSNWWTPGDPDAEYATRGGHNDMFFREGRSAIGIGWPGILGNIMDAGEEIDYGWVAIPAGPRNTDGITTSGGLRNGVMIIQGAEDPHYLIWILDELFAWPGDDWYDLEFTFDQDWARSFMPDEDSVQRLFRVGYEKVVVDIGTLAGLVGGFHNDMAEAWYNGEMTVAQFVEYHRAERQAAIDEWFGN